MYRKPLVVLRRVLLIVLAFYGSAGILHASDWYADPVGVAPVPDPRSPAPPPESVTGKEYSADEVGTAGAGFAIDHDADGVWDHFQNVLWDANLPTPPPFLPPGSGSADGLDYNDPGITFIPGAGNVAPLHVNCSTASCDWVDAIANRQDSLVFEVIDIDPSPDTGDASHLLFSVSGDPAGAAGAKVSVYSQATDALSPPGPMPAAISVWATTDRLNHHTVTPFPAPPMVGFGVIDDIDGLEVYNNEEGIKGPPLGGGPPASPPPAGSGASDSDRFSLDMEASEGVSIWSHDVLTGAAGTNVPYLEHEDLVAAVTALFATPAGGMVDLDGRDADIDLDALMVFDEQTTRMVNGLLAPFDPTADLIIFSIDPIAGTPITGGELMVLGFTPGLSTSVGVGLPSTGMGTDIAFLEHGGMVWDSPTSASVLDPLGSLDIDAIESVSTMIPEPTMLVMLAGYVVGFALVHRRSRR